MISVESGSISGAKSNMDGGEAPSILVVDDDADTRELLQAALSTEGLQVAAANNGTSGLQLLFESKSSFDVVLLDLMLPDINGIECCRLMHDRLKSQCPPVLMITGIDDEHSINQAFAAQVTDFITKPINIVVLVNRIKRVIHERELVKNLEAANTILTQVARTDSLTKIANRHYFQTSFTKEWARLTRERQPVGILMCDLDAFKQYNDQYGHVAGDACLRQFAAILDSSVNRATDLVARYGGEEFVILLPNTDVNGIETIDARIRQQLADRALVHELSQINSYVTYSAGGIVVIPNAETRPESAIELADQALYTAKANGRNRTIVKSYLTSSNWIGD